MTFNSPLFFFFLFIVVVFHYYIPKSFRPTFLTLASIVFVGFYNIESLITLLFISTLNYYLSKKVASNRGVFVFAISINVFAILLFNYFSVSQSGFISSSLHLNNFFVVLTDK